MLSFRGFPNTRLSLAGCHTETQIAVANPFSVETKQASSQSTHSHSPFACIHLSQVCCPVFSLMYILRTSDCSPTCRKVRWRSYESRLVVEQEEEGVVRLALSHSLSPSPAAAAAVLRPAHCLTHQPFFSMACLPSRKYLSIISPPRCFHPTLNLFSLLLHDVTRCLPRPFLKEGLLMRRRIPKDF